MGQTPALPAAPGGAIAPDAATGPAAGPRRFHVMVKPLGPVCNLSCTYCYYRSRADLLGLADATPIADEVLTTFIRQYVTSVDQQEIVLSWQGGEPTLLGLDFFRKVVALEQKFCPPYKRVENDLQTNGTLLDDEWCHFLKEHHFLVGLSIDGPRELHDAFRVNRGGAPTFDRVLAAAKRLRRHGIPFNTLTVVNRRNAQRPLDVYRFLTRDLGSTYVQFIPCVEARGFERAPPPAGEVRELPRVGEPNAKPDGPDAVVNPWSVDPDDYGAFLCKTFDDWLRRDVGKVTVNLFETAVAAWAGLPPLICVFSDGCGRAVMLERDGNLYSCDHFGYPEFRLGNIRETDVAALVFSPRQLAFGASKRTALPRFCRECQWLFACYGECPKNRCVRTPDGEAGLNYLCPGLRRFFAHAHEPLQRLAREVRARGVTPHDRMDRAR